MIKEIFVLTFPPTTLLTILACTPCKLFNFSFQFILKRQLFTKKAQRDNSVTVEVKLAELQ